jgi:hypothetical protein
LHPASALAITPIRPAVVKTAIIAGLLWKKDTALVVVFVLGTIVLRRGRRKGSVEGVIVLCGS